MLRFLPAHLQVVMNVIKGWMCTWLFMSRWGNYILSFGSEVIVLRALSYVDLIEFKRVRVSIFFALNHGCDQPPQSSCLDFPTMTNYNLGL